MNGSKNMLHDGTRNELFNNKNELKLNVLANRVCDMVIRK